jgi:hypothetical protein
MRQIEQAVTDNYFTPYPLAEWILNSLYSVAVNNSTEWETEGIIKIAYGNYNISSFMQ